MGKLQCCRICLTDNRKKLKYTVKQLREINKKQLLELAQGQEGEGETDKASKKLYLSTAKLGNICIDCDERLHMFHRLDDVNNANSDSDLEIDVVEASFNGDIANAVVNTSTMVVSNLVVPVIARPETPVIVDDDDMLYNIFMHKIDQQRQSKQQQLPQPHVQLNQECMTQIHLPYTPPQSVGGSEGDDAKVTTSRESTPIARILSIEDNYKSSVSANIANHFDNEGHRVVAIIDLDDDDETAAISDVQPENILLTPSNNVCTMVSLNTTNLVQQNQQVVNNFNAEDDDDEEIVFCPVPTEQVSESLPSAKKRKRKSYDENQLRLVASLSLLSSDSSDNETECAAVKPYKKSNESIKYYDCSICHIKLPNEESLNVHKQIHQGIQCPVCQFCHEHIHRLVHHMRSKHRDYEGEVLAERPCAQDSALTIRLRYQGKLTFYECQLCGKIDEVFKEHKTHIVQKHPMESKSLKDPIAKNLNCPVCKNDCGILYLTLCRHIILSHQYSEYKSHLRELLHVSAFGWNAARQQEVAKTAKIYQFSKRKTFFFECKICRKVVAGYLNHLKHLQKHNTLKASAPAQPPKLDSPEKTQLPKQSVKTPKLVKDAKMTVKTPNKNTKNTKIKKSKDLKLGKKCKVMTKPVKDPKRQKEILKESNKKSDAVVFKKPLGNENIKNKFKFKLPAEKKHSNKKSFETKPIKHKTTSKDIKTKSPLATSTGPKKTGKRNSQLKIVKSKVPKFRQIDLQSFVCKICANNFEGFRTYNLHLIKSHFQNECPSSDSKSRRKHKRKFVGGGGGSISESHENAPSKQNDSSEHTASSIVYSENDLNHHKWLRELQDIQKNRTEAKMSNNADDSSITNINTALFTPTSQTIQQCCYCLHLYSSEYNLKEHIDMHHLEEQNILIKFKPLLKF